MTSLLLLSGGLDSAAVAAMVRPAHCLYVDYGQIPAIAEHRAARQIASDLALPFDAVTIPAGPIGSGLMASDHTDSGPLGVSAEWWPYRNQLLITVAAAWGVRRGITEVLIGTVASDGTRHADGSTAFLTHMDELLALQEGGLRLHAPAAHLDTTELIAASGISDTVIGWAHSCHRANVPCATCPGCIKRTEVLHATGRLQ